MLKKKFEVIIFSLSLWGSRSLAISAFLTANSMKDSLTDSSWYILEMARTRRLFHDFKEGIQKSVVKKHAAKLNKTVVSKMEKRCTR